MLIPLIGVLLGAAGLRVAPFKADATPARGEPLIWVTPATRVLDPLYAKGVVIESKGKRYVLCAMDWCGVSGRTHRMLREALAKGARTAPERVELHTLHQHSAPYVDGDGYGLLAKLRLPNPPLTMSDAYLNRLAGLLAAAASGAQYRDIDQIGLGEARVDRVASARRFKADGKLIIRFSADGKDPKKAALPEGPIDPILRTLTFSSKGQAVARLHYYATHPQTFCCDGRVSGDMINAAREGFEAQDGATQINFDGAGGNVTVGKYNDGSEIARAALAERLRAGMAASVASTKWTPAPSTVTWKSESVRLPPRLDLADHQAILNHPEKRTAIELYRAAIAVAFAHREDALVLTSLRIGDIRLLHMPGEPLLEFQNYARSLAANVLVAGYGDLQPGYLVPDIAYEEGGYEPGASNAGPGTEGILKGAIRKLLAR